MVFLTYLLLLRTRLKDVIHQHGHQFGYSVYTGRICAIRGRAVNSCSLGFGLLEPFAGYRVYDVKNPQLVCSRRLLEMGIDFLNEYGFGLECIIC